MDSIHLFRVLHSLAEEADYFLLAQDSYPLLCSCILQLQDLENAIAGIEIDMEEELNPLHIQIHTETLVSMKALKLVADEWIARLEELKLKAIEFWHCCPFDRLHKEATTRTKDLWNQQAPNKDVDQSHRSLIDNFLDEVKHIVRDCFPELLVQLQEEEARERSLKELLKSLPQNQLSASVSPISVIDFEPKNRSFVAMCRFPCLYFTSFDKKFADLLGVCPARLMCQPLLSFVFNAVEAGECIGALNSGAVKDSTSIVVIYRTASRKPVRVHWEFGTEEVNGNHVGRGFDITEVVEQTTAHHTTATGKMLRQWLHSIRNASFAQQAELIMEDLQQLKSEVIDQALNDVLLQTFSAADAVEEDGTDHDSGDESNCERDECSQQVLVDSNKLKSFRAAVRDMSDSLARGLRTLIYSAKSTAGLIDHALDSHELCDQSSVGDLVHSLQALPLSFAKSEGFERVDLDCSCVVNGQEGVLPSDACFVAGEVMKLQAILNNLISNSVRYTAVENNVPRLQLKISVDIHDTAVNFSVVVRDFHHGGLPSDVFKYIQESIGEINCVDERNKNAPLVIFKRTSSEKGHKSVQSDGTEEDAQLKRKSARSSGSGIPHIIELNDELTKTLQRDYSLSVRTSEAGTAFTVVFALKRICPAQIDIVRPVSADICRGNAKKLLVVDDTAIIRHIMAKMLQKLNVEFFMCEDGAAALEWFAENADDCAALITDLEMPRMGGEALISAVRTMAPQLPCYIVSGRESHPNEFAFLNVDGVIVKPISPSRMNEIVTSIYTRENWKVRLPAVR